MRIIIDRFEQRYAVCQFEDGLMLNVPLELIPKDAKESDVIFIDETAIRVDKEATEVLKGEIKKLMNKLFIEKED